MRTVLAMFLAALTLTVASGAAADEMTDGMHAYEHARYPEAMAHFVLAANSGNAEAQEIVGLMYAYGSSLYPGVPQDSKAAAAWLDRAARGGRKTARYISCAFMLQAHLRQRSAWNCFDWIGMTGAPSSARR